MSNLTVSTLTAANPTTNIITLAAGDTIYSPGSVVQTVYTRADAQSTYSSATTGDGTTITDLNISITPKSANSMLLMQWMLNGEIVNDNVFLIHQDGVLITQSGYQGYNTVSGNVRYSGYVGAAYDVDTNSTASNLFIQYMIPAGSTSPRTYAPAVRSSTATAATLYLNRTVVAPGAANSEVMVSSGVIWEIAQ